MSFIIQTECAHCGKDFRIEVDSEMNYSISAPDAKPLVFVPMVDFSRLEDPSIIDAF